MLLPLILSSSQVVGVNRSLTEEIETLSTGANDAVGHLHLILEWWSEFTSNHDDISPWLVKVEQRLSTVEAQLASPASPRPCPLSLQQTANVSVYACIHVHVHVHDFVLFLVHVWLLNIQQKYMYTSPAVFINF